MRNMILVVDKGNLCIQFGLIDQMADKIGVEMVRQPTGVHRCKNVYRLDGGGHDSLQVGNIDSTVVAQAPRLAAHIPAMRARMAEALGLALEQVNVKAKTAERLGPVGQCQAIEARAVALLRKV